MQLQVGVCITEHTITHSQHAIVISMMSYVSTVPKGMSFRQNHSAYSASYINLHKGSCGFNHSRWVCRTEHAPFGLEMSQQCILVKQDGFWSLVTPFLTSGPSGLWFKSFKSFFRVSNEAWFRSAWDYWLPLGIFWHNGLHCILLACTSADSHSPVRLQRWEAVVFGRSGSFSSRATRGAENWPLEGKECPGWLIRMYIHCTLPWYPTDGIPFRTLPKFIMRNAWLQVSTSESFLCLLWFLSHNRPHSAYWDWR